MLPSSQSGTGVGTGTDVQLVPFQCSASGSLLVNVAWTPTAQTSRPVSADIPQTMLPQPPGFGLWATVQLLAVVGRLPDARLGTASASASTSQTGAKRRLFMCLTSPVCLCVKLRGRRATGLRLLADVHEDHVRRRSRCAVVVPAARVNVALDRLEAPAGPG